MSTILKIAGSDAPQKIKDACDLVLNGSTDVVDINTFISLYEDVECTINVYRTIFVSGYLVKKRKHNWRGFCAKIKMMDGLSTANYLAGMIPEEGDHKYTYIRDFDLDGNESNCPDASATNYSCGLGHGSYDNVFSPTIGLDALNVRLKNIHSHDWLRSCVLPGTGWKCTNIRCGKSRIDHSLYASGAANLNVENLYLYGHSTNALAISGANLAFNKTAPEDITFKNVVLNECYTYEWGTHIAIRGGSSNVDGSVRTLPCKRVAIHGLKVINNSQIIGSVITIGTSNYLVEDVVIDDIDVSVNCYHKLGYIFPARNVKISGTLKILDNYTIIPLFELYGGGFSINNYDFSGCNLEAEFYNRHTIPVAAFGINGNNDIVGLNLANLSVVNADVFKRSGDGTGTAKIKGLVTTGIAYDKEYNPDEIEIV